MDVQKELITPRVPGKSQHGPGKGIFFGKEAGFFVLALAGALAIWLFVAASYHREAIEDISKSLLTINSHKTAQITDWLERHRREAIRLSRHPFLGEIISEEIARPGSRRRQLEAWLSDHAEQKQYIAMAFLSPKGDVIAETPKYAAGTEKYFKEEFALASRTGTVRITDLYLAASGRPRMTMFSPISVRGRGEKTLCVLVVKIDPEMQFYPLLKAAPLFFAKAETLLVRKEGDYALFLNQLDNGKDTALKFKLPLSDPLLPAAAALNGRTGFFIGVDYRGEKVFSAISHIEGSPWAVITKIDRSAVLGPVKIKEYLALALIMLAAILLYAFVYALLLAKGRADKEVIREGERRLAAVFSNLPGAAFRCANDRDWTMEFLSEGCLGLTGYTPAELMGDKARPFNELIVPEDRERVWQTIQNALSKSKRYELEYSIKCKDGTIKAVWEQGLGVITGPDRAVKVLEGFISDISPLKKAEANLRESEQIFREFLEHSPIYVFFKDENIRATRLSRNYEAMLGRPLEELLGKNMNDLFPSELAEKMVADDKKILAEGKEIIVEEDLNGHSYRTIKFPIKVEGKAPYLAGFTLDITEQKQAVEKLRESEERLRITLEETGIGTWDWDVSKDTWTASATYYTMLGYQPETGPSDRKVWLTRAHPDDKDAIAAKVGAVLSGSDAKYQYEARIRHADGTYRWVVVIGNTIKRDNIGKPARIIGVRMDITERKRSEEALRESEATVRNKLQALLSPDETELKTLELGDILDVPALQAIMDEFYKLTRIGIGIIDIKGKVLVGTGWQEICTKFHRVNPETAKNCVESDVFLSDGAEAGKCKSYLCKNNLRDIATPIVVGGKHLGNIFLGQFLYTDEPRDPELFRQQARRYGFDEKEYLAAYERLPRFSREQVDSVMRFYTKFEELVSALSYGKIKLARALAQSRQSELEKEKLNQDLLDKKEEMENFLYITTHDLRSPLVNIQGFSQNLERYMKELLAHVTPAPLEAEVRETVNKLAVERIPEALSYVQESSRKMDALITALLKVSRLGRVEMKPANLDMNELVGKVRDSLHYQLEAAGGVLRYADLPPCRADQGAISQLFTNLLDNAIKYKSKDRALVINVTGEVKGARVLYTVADNGPGIAETDLPRIWEIFYRPHGTAEKKGEGIGLPMVKRIAEKNGGSIRAESKAGEGAVFYVELPAA